MRITCPNCTAHFEIPAELLGRKGRSLKCASCGHSWYQTPQVETIDLAEIMGEEYAAKAKADMGVGQPSGARPPSPNLQQQRPQAPQMRPPPGMPGMPPGAQAAPLPGGAVSLMGGRQGQPQPGMRPPGAPGGPGMPGPMPGQQGWGNQQQMPGRPPGPPPGAPAWYQPTVGAGAPGAPPGAANSWFNPQTGQPGPPPGAPGNAWYQGAPQMGPGPGAQTAPGWFNPQNAPGAAAAMAANGWQGQQPPPGMAPPPPGAPSWYNPAAAAAGASFAQQAQAAAMGARPGAAMGAPGANVGAAALGQSMVGAAGMHGVPGQGAVSWIQNPGQNIGQPPPGANMGVMHMQRPQGPQAAAMAGQSMVGQAGAGAVGDGAMSWMQQNVQQPGAPGQTMQAQRPMGPGGMPVSQMGAQVAGPGGGAMSHMTGQQIAAPGAGAMSQLSGQQIAAPGAGAMSQLSGQHIAAPGQAAVSVLDGSVQQPGVPGQSVMGAAAQGPGAAAVSQLTGQAIAAPGEAAVSMLDGSVQQGQPGQSMMHEAGAGGQPGTSMKHDAGAGGAAAPDTLKANAAGGAGQEHVGQVGPDGKLVTDPAQAGADADIAASEAEKAADAKSPLFTNAKDDEELVDPDADRPDFGSAEEEAAAEEDAESEDEDEEEAADDEKPKPPIFKPSKSLDPAYITAGLMVAATLSCGAVIYSQRAALMKMMPGMAQIYEKLGMAPKNPGEGLRLAQSGMRLQRIGGVETLVVKGYISNIGQASKNVPNLRLQLIDATNAVVQEVKSAAPKSSLDPGGSVDYEMRLELPDMAKAKNVVVSWDGG